MSDEERIARCIELARRVWPYSDPEVWGDQRDAGVGQRGIEDSVPLISVCSAAGRKNAGEALEAVLLALAGEPPEWVEEIASAWERDATTAAHCEDAGDAYRRCAAELRARAKEGT